MSDPIEFSWEELEARYEPIRRMKALRKERPWAFDLIRVLWARPRGLSNQEIYDAIREIRDPAELPKPKQFAATIRAELNRHTKVSPSWSGNADDDLFHKPRGRGSWAVNYTTAIAWLSSRALGHP
jgi:hypothetical protein